MATKIKPKRKFSTGAPSISDLERGEIAVNTADKKIYMRDDSGGNTPANDAIVEVANSLSGGATVDDAIVMAIALG